MPSDKRQRQDQGRLARLEEERVERRKSQRNRSVRNLVLLLLALLGVAGAIAVLSGDDGDDVEATDDTTTTTEATDDTTGEPAQVLYPGEGAAIEGDTPCPEVDGSSERTTSFEKQPPTCIDAAKTYTATITTTEGDIVIELDDEAAPITVNNFVVLARYHYYDNVPFHRIIPGFMDQAGDPIGPTATSPSPGYTVPDELPTGDDPYPTGTLAMANTGAPNSGGGQWFITVEGGGGRLAPTYTAFGTVVEGQDVVDAINEFGTDSQNGEPTKLIAITSIMITES